MNSLFAQLYNSIKNLVYAENLIHFFMLTSLHCFCEEKRREEEKNREGERDR